MPAEDSARLQRGWERLREIHGRHGEEVVEGLKDVAPDLARYVVEFAFGDVYSRPGLPVRDRQLVTVSVLAALGNARPQLKSHLHGALNVGCTRQELIEALIQIAVYAGFPAALNAVGAAREVFAERDAQGLAN